MTNRWSIFVPFAILIALSATVVNGTPERSYTPPQSISDVRMEQQVRVWTFTHKGQDIGHLVSRVDGTERIDGRTARIVWDSVYVDYQSIGAGAVISSWGNQYISSVGAYLGSDLNLPGQNGVEELSLRMESDLDRKQINGYFTRDGRKLNRSLTITKDMFGWDIHMLDQLELWLTMQSFTVGDTLIDTLFSPQSLLTTPVYGVVDQFMRREIYRNKFDSVFVVELQRPQELQLTFSPRMELVRVDFKSQDIRAYLDYVGAAAPAGKTAPRQASIGVATILRWVVLLATALFALLILTGRGIKAGESWLGLLFGGIVCGLLLLVMGPLQTWLVKSLIGGSGDSGSLLWLWLVPALVLALGQELIKGAGIYLAIWYKNPKEHLILPVAAAFGIGFGLCESAYQTTLLTGDAIVDWTLFGQLFMVLYHGVAGGLVGWAILRGTRSIAIVLVSLILVNGLIHYLPGMVVAELFEAQVSHLATGLIATLLLMISLILFKRR